MNSSIFLAKLIGFYFIIISLYIVIYPTRVRAILVELQNQQVSMVIIAVITLIIGLLLVLGHNIWVMAWPVMVTILSWIVLFISLTRLFVPNFTQKLAQWLIDYPAALWIGVLIHITIGIFLLGFVYWTP